ncbi:MAG: GNAT family N-acetyltransferase [Anaerolineae bacterium]
MVALETDRLLIRTYRPDDWQALHAMITRYQANPLSRYDQPWPTDPAAYPAIAATLAGYDGMLVVCLKDSGEYIGHVTFTPGEKGVFELGYIFDERFHGRGYASEACRAVISRAFSELHACKVTAGTALANTPSLHLLARLGFHKTSETQVSFQVDANGKPIEFTGGWFELTRADWQQLQIQNNKKNE